MPKRTQNDVTAAKPIVGKDSFGRVVTVLDKTLTTTTESVDSFVNPYRQSVLKRFPTMFLLLVTFGVAATFFGFEQILINTPFLSEHPMAILGVGLLVLTLTGRLYKKLS